MKKRWINVAQYGCSQTYFAAVVSKMYFPPSKPRTRRSVPSTLWGPSVVSFSPNASRLLVCISVWTRERHEFQSREISQNVDLRIGTYSAILRRKWDNAIKISVDQKACPPPMCRAHTCCDFQLSRCKNGQYPINQRGFTLRGSTEAVIKIRELSSTTS